MTSQKDQLQTLIADIDKVLQKASPRLPWVISGDVAQQRRVLERVRSYLVSLQQKQASDGTLGAPRVRSNLSAYDIQYQPSQAANLTENQPSSGQQAAAQQILQAVMQEMEQLRTKVTHPLQADLEALQQQREALVQEIRQLESQRHHYSLAQQQANQQQIISEFLKVLMGRLQENLTQQISQTLTTALSDSLSDEGRSTTSPALGGNFAGTPLLHPAQRLEELQMLQARSDHLLMTLDSTLSVLFETLQRNVQSYQESLSRGLERMHDLGQQGDVMFSALVSHLAQQLGREASSYLQSSLQTPSLEPTSTSDSSQLPQDSNAEQPAAGQPPTPPVPQSNSVAELTLPYPGTELPQPLNDWVSPTAPDVNSLDNLDLDTASLGDVDLDVEGLLSEDVSPLDNAFAEENSPGLLSSLSEFSKSGLQTERNLETTASEPTLVSDSGDLDAELDFLQQLNQALQDPSTETASIMSQSSALPDPEVDNSSSTPSTDTRETPKLPDELDEFYTSLFGDGAIAAPDSEGPIISDLENITAQVNDVSAVVESDADASSGPDELKATASPSLSDLAAVVEVESPVSPSPINEPISDLGDVMDGGAEDLFGGFTDLGDVDAAIASVTTSEAEAAEAPNPVLDLDDFSAGFAATSAPLDPLAELADLLGDTPEPEFPAASAEPISPEEAPNDPFSEETGLEDLSDLLPVVAPPASADTSANWLEDSYAVAAPDESLLDSDDLGEVNDVSLWLDDRLVQQLNQDLSTLESTDRSFTLDQTTPAESTDATTLDDFFSVEDSLDTEGQLPEAPATTAPDAASDFTLEALDDFFSDIPPTEPPTVMETEPPDSKVQSSASQYLTEVDTQSITLDDVFADLLTDEKKKIQ